MFSRKMECGIPIGRRFFMAPRRIRLLTCLLPSKRIFPTLTLGPSFTTNVMLTAEGGLGRTSVRTVANCLPCSESSSLLVTSAFVTLVVSYGLSGESPTFRSLQQPAPVLLDTELRPT